MDWPTASKKVTKGREIDLEDSLAFSTQTKETKECKFQVMKPVVKLTDFYVCGPRPAGSGDGDVGESKEAEVKEVIGSRMN